MSDTEITKHIKFQRAVYKVLLCILGPIYTWISQFKYEPYKPKSETFLFLGNHNMNLDPFQAVIGTRRHMRFVSNDAILKSFFGPVVSFFVGPIPRKRGASTDETVDLILRNLKAGISVAMYPESERSWDGLTEAISVKTAQLAKESGAGLITYTTNGNYLRTPHWAKYNRRGKAYGRVMHEYSADELSRMSVEEVYEAICSDLKVNAYEFQRQHMFKYKGRALAENAELVCFICPHCRALGKMNSSGDILKCGSCGYTVKYNVYGFFEGKEAVFDNTASWSGWQKKWLTENAAALKEQKEEPFAANGSCRLYIAKEDGKMKELAEDTQMKLYGDRIDVADDEKVLFTFPLEKITKLGCFGTHMIMFTCDGLYYKIKSDENSISGYQYYGLWRVLTGREYY